LRIAAIFCACHASEWHSPPTRLSLFGSLSGMCSKCGASDHLTEECTPGAFVHQQLRRLRGLTCLTCGEVGHRQSACPTTMRCFVCKMVGHKHSECPVRQKKRAEKEADTQSESTVASSSDRAKVRTLRSADKTPYECSFCGSKTHRWKDCEERLRTVSVRVQWEAPLALDPDSNADVVAEGEPEKQEPTWFVQPSQSSRRKPGKRATSKKAPKWRAKGDLESPASGDPSSLHEMD
jgi:hypothetical protein